MGHYLIDTDTHRRTGYDSLEAAMRSLATATDNHLWRLACVGGSDEHWQGFSISNHTQEQPDYVIVVE